VSLHRICSLSALQPAFPIEDQSLREGYCYHTLTLLVRDYTSHRILSYPGATLDLPSLNLRSFRKNGSHHHPPVVESTTFALHEFERRSVLLAYFDLDLLTQEHKAIAPFSLPYSPRISHKWNKTLDHIGLVSCLLLVVPLLSVDYCLGNLCPKPQFHGSKRLYRFDKHVDHFQSPHAFARCITSR
jgi:hypothetical protein